MNKKILRKRKETFPNQVDNTGKDNPFPIHSEEYVRRWRDNFKGHTCVPVIKPKATWRANSKTVFQDGRPKGPLIMLGEAAAAFETVLREVEDKHQRKRLSDRWDKLVDQFRQARVVCNNLLCLGGFRLWMSTFLSCWGGFTFVLSPGS